MTISISTIEDEEILEVVYASDHVTPEALAAHRELVAEAVSKGAIHKALIDATSLVQFPSVLHALEHNESVAANEALRTVKFAVVCTSIGADERALENTGVNRGLDIKCFTSRDDALAWLRC